jgi:trypsin
LTLTEDVTEVTEFPKRPTSELNDFDISCTALGKGLTSYPNGTASPKLKKTNVRPISKIQCDYDWRGLVPRKTICATTDGTGTCYGDSGGPLLCNDELTGVVSFGYPCGTGVPDIYTDVYDFNDWIDSEIGEN